MLCKRLGIPEAPRAVSSPYIPIHARYQKMPIKSRTRSSNTIGHGRTSWVHAASAPLFLGGVLLAGQQARAQSADAAQPATSSPQLADASATAAGAGAPGADSSMSVGPMQAVVITGSHIQRKGYDSPQPVTAISQNQIDASAPSNIADFAMSLPAIRGSTNPQNSSGSLSNGEAGVAALNLRDLGTNRTLVLVDGDRWAPSTVEDLVDVNTIPQSLVKGIQVTTGGASAAYGSGAVGGVVNFILDTKYAGVKSSYQYSEDQLYGDPTRKFDLTAGMPFAGGRAHALFSGEVFGENGITIGTVPDWEQSGYRAMPNPDKSPGAPEYYVGHDIGISTYTPGGLITSGPLKGTYFGVNGTVNQLAYGNVGGQWMQGGDWQYTTSGELGSNSLAPQQQRDSAFTRFSFDLTPDAEVYTELSYGRYEGLGYYDSPTTTGITIQSDNAYLPSVVKQEMAADGISSFTMGTSNADMPPSGSNDVRSTQRYLLGGDGDFDFLDEKWKWDTHLQVATTRTQELLTNTYNNALLAMATDAVLDPATGQVACRSTLTNPTNGCVPLDVFGPNAASSQSLAYVLGTPERHEKFGLDEAAANLSTNDIPGLSRPISVAVGGEGRKESVSGTVDPYYSSGWKYGNYKVNTGSYTVAEGYLETLVPLFYGLDFNGAARYTSYSTSGGVNSWKLGITYTPMSDVTFRATRSSDIRAGDLAELYSTGTAITNAVSINGRSVLYTQQLLGSTHISPETARTNVYGVVYQPSFLPAFEASVDYYDIEVSKVISYVSAQQTADFCNIDHVQSYCNNMVYSGSTLEYIYLYYQNLNSMTEKGLDLEASYHLDLADHLPWATGSLIFHALATHYINNTTNNGVNAIDLAGSNYGDTPNWIYRLEATYNSVPWTFDVVARGVSAGNINSPSGIYVQCTANCPTLAAPYFTVNDNHAAGAIFFDASITHHILTGSLETDVFFAMKNVLNKEPPLIADPYTTGSENTPAYPPTNSDLYDIFGRVFTLGVRVNFQ
jgi:iron complex outermembrane recepter protein